MKKLLILLACVLTLLPLFHGGLFDVHDPTSIVRFFTLNQTLSVGQFPAAWTNLLNQGYGYPIFLYYAPVFSYLGVLLKLMTPTYLLAMKIAMSVVVLAAAFGMYRLMRRFVGAWGAVISAIAYTLLPYHASTLYVRGAYAEGVTWAVLPWLLYAWSAEHWNKRWVALTGLVTSLFFLSHNSLPFAFLPFLVLWILLYARKNWQKMLFALCLAGGLCAWFLAPVLFERNIIQVEKIADLTVYSDHFLYPIQLWNSPWGYGGSAPMNQVDGMSFMLGKFQVLIAGLTILYLAIKRKWNRQLLFFLSLTLFYAWMTTYLSAPVWTLVKGLAILQFPWRLLAFTSFGVAVLCGYALEYLPKKLQVLSFLVLMGGMVFFNLKFFVPERYVPYTDADFLSQEKLDTTASDKIPEYLPKWVPTFATHPSDDGLMHNAISTKGTVHFSVSTPIIVNTDYMPQWKLKVDNAPQAMYPSPYGTIVTQEFFPPGAHQVELTWQRTNIEQIGIWISIAALVVVLGLSL